MFHFISLLCASAHILSPPACRCFGNNCREYAETVGRKVRDLGMVVDLIFLNTEVSLTQALEDVGRARTPFAIIITQQHQVHRSCTVNILFGTPQGQKREKKESVFLLRREHFNNAPLSLPPTPTIEHRNMPMQDAMMLVAHNYDTYKVENREKEREEIARKAAKMADDVLLREPDRESHPISVLTTITLLSENRFLIQQLEMPVCEPPRRTNPPVSLIYLFTFQVCDS